MPLKGETFKAVDKSEDGVPPASKMSHTSKLAFMGISKGGLYKDVTLTGHAVSKKVVFAC